MKTRTFGAMAGTGMLMLAMTTTKLAFMSFLLAAVCWAQGFDIVTRSTPQPGVDQIRIDRPNPTKRSVDYRQITFQPDDDVTIIAGGCVQSGGVGSTWHRYVNPSGGDADKLYHGLITIPFATGSLERIQKYQNKRVHVAPNAQPGTLHLQLGFEDVKYSDNGYYRHDDGPNDQCKGATGGPAWVVLTVRHKGGSGPVTSAARDWDLNVTNFDDNGIPLNPDWHHPFPNPDTCRWPWNDPSSKPDCVSTGQITNTDEHYTCEAWYHGSDHGLGGHANWTAATFSGQVYWDGHSNSVSDDDDYAMNIYTPGQAIATAGRIDGVHVEFSSDETVDVLVDDFKLPKWTALRKAVDDGDRAAQRFIGGSDIVVTGLLGVDFVHTPGAESHPAWAFAWHANSDFADDTWSFFVRGWGNEGYCSGDQHYISYLGNQYTFRFKWPAGATAGVVKSGTTFLTNATNVGAATVSFVPNQAVLLTFHDLPDPTVQGLVGGELHVSWTGTPSAPRASGTVARQPATAAESLIEDALEELTPAQRAVYTANVPAKTRTPAKPVVAVRWQAGPPPAKFQVNQHPQVRFSPDAAVEAHKNAQIEALKKAGGKVPVPPHPQHHTPGGVHPTPGAGSPPPATGGEEFPFNLVWDSLAPGGFPLNPRWNWQVDHDGSPNPSICHYFSNGDGDPSYSDCTNQTHEENLPEDFNGWWCRAKNWVGEGFPGHLNWFTSTYEGQASWTDSNIDDDYNVALVSSGAPGVMTGRVDLHTEFDADEMDIEHFVGPWWKAIYWAAEHGDKYAVKPVFAPNGSIPAIMTGMFGIDCEHDGCKSELHPVYAMAAHVNDDQDNDAWAMFVRNNGDEGYCSSRLVPANFTSYTFHLPWRAGKTGVQVRSGTIWGGYPNGVRAPIVTWMPDRGVDVTFELPSADQSPLIEGELHLQWTGQGPIAPPLPPVILATAAPESGPKADRLAAAVHKLRPEQRREISRISVRNGQPSRALHVLPLRPAKRVNELTSVAHESVRSGRLGPRATAMLAREQAKMRALCRFAGTSDATLREACSKLKR